MIASVDRRAFLCGSAVAAAGAGLLASGLMPALAAPGSDTKKYKKAVKYYMVQTGGTLADKMKLLKRLGFDGLELDSPNEFKLDEVLKARDESQLAIPGLVDSIHWKERLSDPDPEVRAKGLAALKTALKDAKAYGATSVLLVVGKVDDEANYQQCWERSQAEVRKAIPLAEELGIDILVENVWNDFLTDPKEIARYIDELGSLRVGSHFDVGNAVRYGPPAEWVPVLGKRIKKLDIKEFSLAKAKEKLYAGFDAPLLEGDCHWPAVMKALREVGYYGWGTAEIKGGDEKWLADVAARMDRIFAS